MLIFPILCGLFPCLVETSIEVRLQLKFVKTSFPFILDVQHRHCSSPGGVMDGKILVEDDTGALTDFTTVTWQIGLGETLCYK